VSAFHVGIGISAALVVAGGLISAAGIRNPRRELAAAQCPGGAICGASQEVGRIQAPRPATVGEPEPARA
jgi:hypothetical protein